MENHESSNSTINSTANESVVQSSVMMDSQKEEQSQSRKNKFSMWKVIKKIMSLLITMLLVGYIVIVFTDYLQANNSENPKFCYEEVVIPYDDGTTTEYKCLGYKIFKYERASINAYEFGFFITEKNISQN